MGIKKFINSLKNFGDTISSAADTFLGQVKRGLIFLERDKPQEETDED
jgi:hypothetical protein